MREVLVLAAKRTAIGGFLGSLKDVSAVDMTVQLVTRTLKQSGISPEAVDEVIVGCAIQAGMGQNPARQVLIKSGIPKERTAYTVNEACGSGMRAVMLAAGAIRTGEAEVVIAGGMESMSGAPYLLEKGRQGYRLGNDSVVDSLIKDGLWCAFGDYHMGLTAEKLSEKYSISREEQDTFAVESQRKYRRAQEKGFLKEEIIPLELIDRKGRISIFDGDEHPRPDTTIEKLAKLEPVFKKNGTVTAGNASGINDGAAILVLASSQKAQEMRLSPLATIKSMACAGVSPEEMGLGPVAAVKKLLDRGGSKLSAMDLIESNEAFAVQTLAVGKDLSWDWQKVNVNGGAIAMGHPIGASGARILVTLIHALRNNGKKEGLATLCVGGGEGLAVCVGR
jgi:acetyl-CoA C-acetyltransferase